MGISCMENKGSIRAQAREFPLPTESLDTSVQEKNGPDSYSPCLTPSNYTLHLLESTSMRIFLCNFQIYY
jgi:hypothetical protein